MIAGLKTYLAMKDSGVPWLGAVPEHWEVRRLKYVLRERDRRSASGTEQLLRVSQYTGVTERRRDDGDTAPDTRASSLIGYKSVDPRDLVVNIMLAWNGSLGVSAFTGITSPAYCVYRVEEAVEPWYLHHLLRSPIYKARIKAVSTGVVESRLRLYSDNLYQIEALLPPIGEQAAIVRFLDHTDRRIRRYIRAKQKMIKLLEEQKQAIIHRAVTRGLNPNIRLKPSGVEWLGDVPEHWNMLRLKDAAVVQMGVTLGKDHRSTATKRYPYLRVANVQTGRVDLRVVKEIDVPETDARRSMLRPGDVLMTEGGDIDKLGRGCVWNGQISECLHQNHVFAVRCGPRLVPEFLVGLMASTHGRSYFRLTAKQTTNLAATNSSTLRAFPIVIPPVDEQKGILRDVSLRTLAIERTLADASRGISILQEYRTRLIADVVTGKLDVREAAASIPDESAESAPIDESDFDDGTDEAGSDDIDDAPEETEE